MKRRVASGAVWNAGMLVVKHAFSTVIVAVLTRKLEPAAFGEIAVVLTLCMFVTIFIDVGGSTAIVQLRELSDRHLQTAFCCVLATTLVMMTALLIFAEPLSHYFGSERLAPLFRWTSLLILIQSLSIINQAILLKNLEYRTLAIRTAASKVVGGLAALAAAFLGAGVWALYIQALVSAGLAATILWIKAPFRPQFEFSWDAFKDLARIGYPVAASSLAWFFTSRLDQIAIGRVLGPATLGIYSIAGKLPEMLNSFLNQPVQSVMNPAFARLQGNIPRMREALYYGTRVNAVIAVPAYMGVALLAADIVPIVFGTQWAVASSVCVLLCLLRLAQSVQVCFYPVMLATRSMRAFAVISYTQAVVVVGICLLGVSHGIVALAAMLLLNTVVFGVIVLVYFSFRLALSSLEFVRCLVPSISSAIAMIAAVYFAKIRIPAEVPAIIGILFLITLGMVVYFAMLYIFHRRLLKEVVSLAVTPTMRQRIPFMARILTRMHLA